MTTESFDTATTTVTDEPTSSRYELHRNGELIGFADYRRSDGTIVVPHVEVNPAHGGQGMGGRLMQGLLDDVRGRGERIVPVCPFAAAYIDGHPAESDLLA